MPDSQASIGNYVDASAALLAMPLDTERRAAVVAAMTRIAAFAGDLAGVPLANGEEIAGVVVP
jgi:hypothetical protein